MDPRRKALLAQLKAADLKMNVPSVSEPNAAFLAELVIKNQYRTGLEIGTAHAYSTIWLGDAFSHNQGTLRTIEHSPPSFQQAKINLFRAKLENVVTPYLGRAQTVLTDTLAHERFDFIFIDGIKKSTTEFFQLCTPLLKPDGLIVIDDVLKFKAKMQDFYDFLETQSDWQYEIKHLDEDDGIMLIRQN